MEVALHDKGNMHDGILFNDLVKGCVKVLLEPITSFSSNIKLFNNINERVVIIDIKIDRTVGILSQKNTRYILHMFNFVVIFKLMNLSYLSNKFLLGLMFIIFFINIFC